ncbi:MAG: hypothetical protein IH868_09410 [Chloroflexi bacterium]|nr:hypothetical protein [Chloroflexota bacterium]
MRDATLKVPGSVPGFRLLVVTAIAVIAVACGSSDTLSNDDYAAEISALAERTDAREQEIGKIFEGIAPSPVEVLAALSEALPRHIDGVQADIAALEAIEAPEDYSPDHQRVLKYLRDDLVLSGQALEAVNADDFLRQQQLENDSETLQRNLLADLSESFRSFFLISDEAIAAGETFGGLSDEESAYLDVLNEGWQEFAKRNAVFAQAVNQQFADERAMLKALADAGAGTAFEAVRTIVEKAVPPPRFEAGHVLLMNHLDELVRIDRIIGQAARDGDALQFLTSNFELGSNEASIQALLGVPPQIAEVVFGGSAFAFAAPDPSVLDGGYREQLYGLLREFRARFPQTGPDYAGFNLTPTNLDALVSQAGPGFIATVEDARSAIAKLTPPPELSADHELIVQYFDDVLASQNGIATAAAAGDRNGVQQAADGTRAALCDTRAGLSDEIEPVVFVQFGAPPLPPGFPDPVCG